MTASQQTPSEKMHRLDALFAHVWMVRTFLKHSDEAAEDEELAEVHRQLYDVLLSLGAPLNADDAEGYLKLADKKLSRLKQATELFVELQPQISTHTNFKMAVHSLTTSVGEIGRLLAGTAD